MMVQILRIDSSSRLQGSHSRELADFFQATWLQQYPDDEVIRRDLVAVPIPHITETTIAGYYTPQEQHTEAMQAATALSDELIAELMAADVLLLSVPMYNFSIPSSLKAYIDQIVRVGYTFDMDPERGFYGLVENKQAFVTVAYGAAGYLEGPFSAMNFLEPYLEALLGFLGIKDIKFFAVEGTSVDPSAFAITKQQIMASIEHLVQTYRQP
ncbi:MAG: NAD(P)H-dependent oxidoreductase [Cyanobacteria bacterium P01_F01_bin.86]